MYYRFGIKRLLIIAVLAFGASFALGSESIQIERLSVDSDNVQLPQYVTISPFRAYSTTEADTKPSDGTSEKFLFNGKITVSLQEYLTAVVLGEIDIARRIGNVATNDDGNYTIAQREAFRAQVQAALNCLLFRVAHSADYKNAVVIMGDTVTLSGDNPANNKSRPTGTLASFQGSALPMDFGKLIATYGTIDKGTVSSFNFGKFDSSSYFVGSDSVFGIVYGALQRYSNPNIKANGVLIATLPGKKDPLNLPFYDVTSTGMTYSSETAGEAWQPHEREQVSPEYSMPLYYESLSGKADTNTVGTVGLIQKGMIAMAGQGLTADQILNHYYHFSPPYAKVVEVSSVPWDLATIFEQARLNNGLTSATMRDLLFTKGIAYPRYYGASPSPVKMSHRWRRNAVNADNPLGTTRDLVKDRDKAVGTECPIGVTVYFSEKVHKSTMDNMNRNDPYLQGLVKFSGTWSGAPLLTSYDLGGTVFVLQSPKAMWDRQFDPDQRCSGHKSISGFPGPNTHHLGLV